MRGGFQAIIRRGECVVWPYRATGRTGLRTGETPRKFDITSPGLGDRLVGLLEECLALPPATREECKGSVAKARELLGGKTMATLEDRYAMVSLTEIDGERQIGAVLLGWKSSDWSEPYEQIPQDLSPVALERLFRHYAAMAEWRLIDLGKLKGEATFPRDA